MAETEPMPRLNDMNYFNFYRTAFIATWLGLTLSACQSSDSKHITMSSSSASPALASAAPSIQPMCLGRFIVDLPAGFVRTGDGRYKYRLLTIEKPLPVSQQDFTRSMDQLESKLKTTKHEKDPSLLLKSVTPGADSHVLAYWEESFSAGLVNVDGHKWSGGQHFVLKAEVDDDKYDRAVSAMSQILPLLRSRTEADIPGDPGFCFNGGFIADAQWKSEEVLAGVDLAQYPDVHISIHFYPLSKNAQDKPLLDRVDGGLQKLANLVSSMHALRKGARTVAGFVGQEYLIAAPNESGLRAHMFTWETQGNGTIETPFITIEMTSGNRDDNGNSRQTKLTDEQALKLWDSIVNTFRVRPTSAPPAKVSEAPPPLAPLGELAATGRVCPQTGWWQCSEEAVPTEGGRRRLIHQGETMPRVTLLGEPSLLQRLKGERPEYRRATVWTLVEYEEVAAANVPSQSDLGHHTTAHAEHLASVNPDASEVGHHDDTTQVATPHDPPSANS